MEEVPDAYNDFIAGENLTTMKDEVAALRLSYIGVDEVKFRKLDNLCQILNLL